MSNNIITIILAGALIFSYIIYMVLKIKENEEEERKIDKLIKVIKEYAKDQPRLKEIMNKMGFL